MIKFINGDLFSLTPTATFTDIKPGQSVRIEFIDEDPVVNITDGQEGFYVVWDSQPDKGYNTGAFIIKPFSIYLSQQWGFINNVPVNEFECTGKYYMKRYNIHIGLEHLKIGTPLYSFVSVGGGISL